MDETVKSSLVEAVIALAKAQAPTAVLMPKYGGTVFVTDPDLPESEGLVGGVFAYTGHVSVEFSHGAGFQDPGGCLEGKGKARRHVKLHALGDIEAKDVAGFLRQAFSG